MKCWNSRLNARGSKTVTLKTSHPHFSVCHKGSGVVFPKLLIHIFLSQGFWCRVSQTSHPHFSVTRVLVLCFPYFPDNFTIIQISCVDFVPKFSSTKYLVLENLGFSSSHEHHGWIILNGAPIDVYYSHPQKI